MILKDQKQKGSQHCKVDRKKDSRFCKKTLRQIYIQFPHYPEKKLLLPGTQIVITTMFGESSHLPSVSVPLTPVVSSAYHLSSMIHTSSSVLLFKTSLISTFNQSFCLLWNVIDHCSCVSVKKQNSPANQIRNAWHISNESQLQSYIQWESWWFFQMLNNFQ